MTVEGEDRALGTRAVQSVDVPLVRPLDGRKADIATLANETWDVLIVGGGIVGAGALLDAASR